MTLPKKKTRIIIVGGGAGGLELVSRLSRQYRNNPHVTITLVNNALTHIWKPHYHEIGAGTLSADHGVNYLLHAANNKYDFFYGTWVGLDRQAKTITVQTEFSDAKSECTNLSYDVLVIAVGSITNHFNIPGVKEYCYTLDTLVQAQRFHEALLQQLLKSQHQPGKPLNIVIVGGGATSIELATELHYALHLVAQYGFPHFNSKKDVSIHLIEAADSVLNHIPGRLPSQVQAFLSTLPIHLHCNELVIEANAETIITDSGMQLPCDLAIWVAGIKGPPVLTECSELSRNNVSQLIVQETLQTTDDPNIFAFGDCAQCTLGPSQQTVPPRAQAANQQAKFLSRQIPRYLRNEDLISFSYHDYGSLISLSHGGGIGELMVRVLGEFKVRGFFARVFYRLLYFTHQVNTLGLWRVLILSIAQRLTRQTQSRLKLH